jgi:hypothetical protein
LTYLLIGYAAGLLLLGGFSLNLWRRHRQLQDELEESRRRE